MQGDPSSPRTSATGAVAVDWTKPSLLEDYDIARFLEDEHLSHRVAHMYADGADVVSEVYREAAFRLRRYRSDVAVLRYGRGVPF